MSAGTTSTKPASAPHPRGRGTPAIECVDVWKQYYFYAHRPRKLKDALYQLVTRKGTKREPVWAIRDFNLAVYPGETLGVLGHNGAGKSTLLKLLSRILIPTRGTVTINGRLGAIIELGAGFHEDLTARENVYLAASLKGLRRRDVDALYPRIVDFAELEEHMDTPVKYFSSGMHARLGFAIAVSVEPDVLLIDEVLAVGDARFRPKCKDAIRQFQKAGKAIVFVSHDAESIKSLCTRALWMDKGAVHQEGPAVETVNAYFNHYWPGSVAQMEAQKRNTSRSDAESA